VPTFLHALLVVAFLLLAGCSDPAPTPPPVVEAPTDPAESASAAEPEVEELAEPEASPPAGGLICQPTFHFEGGDSTQQGTGFFAAAADGEVLGVTSAHFIDFEGAKMVSAAWHSVEDNAVIASFTHSYGPPGNAGDELTGDMREDYLIFSGGDVATAHNVLALDERAQPEVGEPIWFPNKNASADWGHQIISGKVTETEAKFSLVTLDKYITLRSQSGSPIISQRTGKVIGTLSRGGMDRGRTVLILCPSKGILDMIAKTPGKQVLADAIGK
jgi:hypothetical protein